jgi:hypothetical protein
LSGVMKQHAFVQSIGVWGTIGAFLFLGLAEKAASFWDCRVACRVSHLLFFIIMCTTGVFVRRADQQYEYRFVISSSLPRLRLLLTCINMIDDDPPNCDS